MLRTPPAGNSGTREMRDRGVGSVLGQKTIRVLGVSVGRLEPDDKPLCIKLKLDGVTFSKFPPIGPKPIPERRKWPISLNLQEHSKLTVRLWRERQWHRNEQLAVLTTSFDNIRLFLDSEGRDRPTVKYQIHAEPKMWLELENETGAPREHMNNMAIQKSEEIRSVLDHLSKWRGPLDMVLKTVSVVSELHPAAKAALRCVNILYDLLQTQDRYIKQTHDLVKSMDKTCGYICDVEQFAHLPRLKKTMEEARYLMEGTENLIHSWTAKRGTISFLKDDAAAQEKLEELVRRYNAVLEQFDRGITIDTAAKANMLLNQQENEEDEKLLKGLWPKGIESARTVVECMEGTREYLLSDIDSHLSNLEGPNVLWVKGHPGVGKSTLASTLASRLRDRGQLGSYFVFERAKANATTPNALWRFVAHHLAESCPSARQCIVEELKVKGVLDTPSSEELFKRIVEQPLKKAMDAVPEHQHVIVIDGLDECGGLEGRRSEARKALLKSLKRWPQLSSRAKLIITSREEEDITTALSPISHPIHILSGTSVTPETSNDIRTFFVRSFREIAEQYNALDDNWPVPSVIDTLTARAAGLFIWAKTTVGYVGDGEPTARLQEITSHSLEMGDMAHLYSLILKTHFSRLKPMELHWFRVLVGAVVLAKQPLSRVECISLLEIKELMLNLIRNGLRSVMDPGETLTFAHQSFVDFLLSDSDCPPEFFINPKEQHYLVEGCLRTMSLKLQFNICGLKTSAHRNAEISTTLEDGIPSHLSYACCHWASHLLDVPYDEGHMEEVKRLIYDQLLFWLEVMSLLGEMDKVPSSLHAVLAWSKLPSAGDGPFQNFVKDAIRFVLAFGQPIAKSAPHIYISALPFAPEQSLVAQHFLIKYPNTISLTTGKLTRWPSNLFIVEHHKELVTTIVFSQDQRYFASCADTICIYNVETGNLVSGPIILHPHPTGTIVFSPNGEHLASGSWDGTISIWNREIGKERQCFQAPSSVIRLAYSNDGHKIASCGLGGEIRVWDVESGRTDKTIKSDNQVSLIVFSHDDQSIISASTDGDVEIWDVHLGERTSVVTQEIKLRRVALSPDGRFMAGLDQSFIYVWNSRTGALSVDRWVCQAALVVYSANGKYLAFVETSSRVEVWDPFTGQMMFGPLLAHTHGATAAALSDDGKRIALGFADGTVGLWNLDNLEVPPSPNPTPTSYPQSRNKEASESQKEKKHPTFPKQTGPLVVSQCGGKIALHSNEGIWVWDVNDGSSLLINENTAPAMFSPDEKLIASVSRDGAICVWDAKTGHLICSSTPSGYYECKTWLAFSPDGKSLVSRSNEMVHMWNVETMKNPVSHTLPGVELALAGTLLLDNMGVVKVIWYDKEGLIQIWSTEIESRTQNIVLKCPLGKPAFHFGMVFSPTGKLVCSYGSKLKEVIIWDVESGEMITNIFADEVFYNCQAFSPDDRLIALGHPVSGTIEIFDLATRRLIHGPWSGHPGGVSSIGFSADGKKLVSFSDRVIRTWDVSDLTGISPAHPSQMIHNQLAEEWTLEAGWVMTANREMLFWVPLSHRIGLWWPRNTAVITEAPTKLDFTKFQYGDDWEKCQG